MPNLSTGSFLPVTIEQLAREQGVLWSDRSVPCTKHKDEASTAALLVRSLFRRNDGPEHGDNQCLVKPFGVEMTTASLSLYTISAAVLIQAIVLISVSAIADYGKQGVLNYQQS